MHVTRWVLICMTLKWMFPYSKVQCFLTFNYKPFPTAEVSRFRVCYFSDLWHPRRAGEVRDGSYFNQNHRKLLQVWSYTYHLFCIWCQISCYSKMLFFPPLSLTPLTAPAHSTLSQAAQIYAYRRQCDGILSGQTKSLVTSVALQSFVKAERNF